MNRREFLAIAAGAPAAAGLSSWGWGSSAPAVPIIDTHIHLFDPSRPQGVPWPTKKDGILYQPALPDRYRKIAVPLGIVGAIEVEASPWLEDNQWVLDVAAKDKIIVGTVGNLEPGKPGFRKQLERFQLNPLFRGIRYGNLWDRNLGRELSKADFAADLRALADAELGLDTANPNPTLIADVVTLTDRVPTLRVVIDHLPQLETPADTAPPKAYQGNLRSWVNGRRFTCKFRRSCGGWRRIREELSFYRARRMSCSTYSAKTVCCLAATGRTAINGCRARPNYGWSK